MLRAIKLKLYCTKSKKRKINALIFAYRKAVNFYIRSLVNEAGKLDKQTLDRLDKTKLSQRYKSNALKQALGIWNGCEETAKKIPVFSGYPVLDHKFVDIQDGNNNFDLYIKLSSLSSGNKIYLPSKKTKVFNYWKEKGKLIQGCELRLNKIIVAGLFTSFQVRFCRRMFGSI